MSNRIINIGTQTESQQNEIENKNVYVDISMTSNQKPDGTYRIANSVDVQAVHNSINNIFSWIPGERILNPEFGSNLHTLLYEGITKYNEEQIVVEIKNSIQKWEPRVVVTKVINRSNVSDTEDNTIVLDIQYYIKGLPEKLYDKQYIFNRNM